MDPTRTWRHAIVMMTIVLAATGICGWADGPGAGTATRAGGPSREGPAPTGPYAVGRRLVHWIDSARPDPLDATRPRELLIWIWYPAEPPRAVEREEALPGTWGTHRLEMLEKKFGAEVGAAMRTFRVHARTDAPLSEARDRLPVVLFTPGLGWVATDYSVLLEDLASHGYIVVGLSPTGFADVVRFPDGRDVRRTLGVGASVGVDQVHVHEDALFALQQIERLDDEVGSFLRGRLDLTRIGALGHSIGGTTAHVAAARDPAVRAAINIDGDPMGAVLDVRPRQPLLLISSEAPLIEEAQHHPSAEHMERVRQGLERSELRRTNDWTRMSEASVSAYRLRIAGTRHLNFEDVAIAADRLLKPSERWMRVGQIDGARGLTVAAALVRGFFDHTLAGTSNGPWQPARDFPEVTLVAR
jgi:pimeloyl-ACP methyl ester carboxylesterase